MPPSPPQNPNQESSAGLRRVQQFAAFTGPLPPPEVLKKYDEALPGTAERILRMAERENEHRIGWESRTLEAGIEESKDGGKRGYYVTLLLIVGAIACGMAGNKYSAAVGMAMLGPSFINAIRALLRRFESKKQAPQEKK